MIRSVIFCVFALAFCAFPPFSRVSVPLATRFRSLLAQVCPRPRLGGHALRSSPSVCRGGRESAALLHSCQLPVSGGERAARVGFCYKGADAKGRLRLKDEDCLLQRGVLPPLLNCLLLSQRGVAQCSRRDRDGGGIRELRGLAASAWDRAGKSRGLHGRGKVTERVGAAGSSLCVRLMRFLTH